MRNYELVFIANPELDENALVELTDKVKQWITDAGGTINKVDYWGKKKLAYPIRKQTEGQYVIIQTQMDPSYGITLERNLRLSEPVIRFLLINT